MLRVFAALIRLVAAVCSCAPIRRRVVFMSRQSAKPSLDMRLLAAEFERAHPSLEQRFCLTEPEKKTSLFSFARATVRQVRLSRTSCLVVVDGYIPAVSIPAKRSGVHVVQLWHALGAMKMFGYQALGKPGGRTQEQAAQGCMHKNYDLIVAGGPGAVGAFSQAFSYAQSAFAPVGLPRVDYLLDPNPESTRRQQARRIAKVHPELFGDGSRIVLYAPTARQLCGRADWLPVQLARLAAFVPEGMRVVVAGHPLEAAALGDDALPSCVGFVPGAATIDLLELADVVLSDYSAIVFEAALAKKPVRFYVPDIEEYRETVGLNIDPLAAFPDVAASDPERAVVACVATEPTPSSFDVFSATYFDGVEMGVCKNIVRLLEVYL